MKDVTINNKAYILSQKGEIRARIIELQEEQKKKSDITKDEVLRMLKNIMYADIRNFLTLENGVLRFKDSTEWTDDMAMQVEGVKQTKDGIEIKLNGRAWSIQRICKMLGFDAPQELNVNTPKPMSMEEAKKIIAEL